MDGTEFVIFVNGSYGTGKSAVLDHLGDRLFALGRPFALFDVDWFHRSWPPADYDPDNVLVEAENLAAVWANYRRSGVRQPVVAGVIASTTDRDRYAAAFGLPIRPVLLTASAQTTTSRLRGRYTGEQQRALAWHLERHHDAAARIRDAGQYETVIATDTRTPDEIAGLILAHVGF